MKGELLMDKKLMPQLGDNLTRLGYGCMRFPKHEDGTMNMEEAILQMEMLQHDFFVFLNMETDSVSVVYKRKDGAYGLLETSH